MILKKWGEMEQINQRSEKIYKNIRNVSFNKTQYKQNLFVENGIILLNEVHHYFVTNCAMFRLISMRLKIDFTILLYNSSFKTKSSMPSSMLGLSLISIT